MTIAGITTALFALPALTAAGAGVAAQLFLDHELAAGSGNAPVWCQTNVSPVVLSEDAATGMVGGGIPEGGQGACFLISIYLQGNSSETRIRDRGSVSYHLPYCCFVIGQNSGLCSSPGRVSSALGRQQTLVGAKPSGTS